MRTYLLLALVASGAMASAAEYEYVCNTNGNGGLLSVADGATVVVNDTDVLTFDSQHQYSGEYVLINTVGYGGVMYVGNGARLELCGTHTFARNEQSVLGVDTGVPKGTKNDIYLQSNSTLVLSATEETDTITIGSGVRAADGTATVVKTGEGKLVFAEEGSNADMKAALDVQSGVVEVQSGMELGSLRVSEDASVTFAGDLFYQLGSSECFVFTAYDWSTDFTLSGLEISDSGVVSIGEEKSVLNGVDITVYQYDNVVSTIDNVAFVDSYVYVDTAATLRDVSLNSGSSISAWGDSGSTMLEGDNFLEISSLESEQLFGVTLADGSSLTVTLSQEILDGIEGDTFEISLENLSLAEGATVTLNVQFAEEVTSTVTLTSQEYTGRDLVVQMSIGTPAVPEPATATLSLLALAGLAARRRRSA